uniref:Uncharacterized protein n=1 Tax=Macaca fascicularis TaxID=9541 RepID=A0A7N9CJI6_MACFA
CWELDVGLLGPKSYQQCLKICLISFNSSRVHVHNVQVCYICILVPCWCAAPINLSAPINSSFTSG